MQPKKPPNSCKRIILVCYDSLGDLFFDVFSRAIPTVSAAFLGNSTRHELRDSQDWCAGRLRAGRRRSSEIDSSRTVAAAGTHAAALGPSALIAELKPYCTGIRTGIRTRLGP